MPGGRPKHPDVLTPAELRVFEAIRRGLTNGEIADELAISLNTVKYHVSNILGKLGVATREDLAAMSHPRRWWGWLLSAKVLIASAATIAVLMGGVAIALVLAHDNGSASAEPRNEPSGSIAFVMANPDGRGTQIWVRPADAPCDPPPGSCPGVGFPAQQSDQVQLWPTWSPDGTSLAWVGLSPDAHVEPGDSSVGTLMVGERDGSHSTPASQHVSVLVADGAVPRPVWRSDGSMILYTSGDFAASRVAPDGSSGADEMLGCVTPSFGIGDTVGLCATLDPGTASGGRGPNSDITIGLLLPTGFRLPETRIASRSNNPTYPRTGIAVPGIQVQPILSDDGAWLAWWGYAPGEPPHVYAAPVQPDRQIIKDKMVDLGPGQVPEFAPGSHLLVFSTTTDLSFPPALAAGDIVTVDLDSRKTSRLTDAGANRWPTWSPDGQWIAFESDRDEPHGELYIMRADGSDVRRLTSNTVAESMPDWSAH